MFAAGPRRVNGSERSTTRHTGHQDRAAELGNLGSKLRAGEGLDDWNGKEEVPHRVGFAHCGRLRVRGRRAEGRRRVRSHATFDTPTTAPVPPLLIAITAATTASCTTRASSARPVRIVFPRPLACAARIVVLLRLFTARVALTPLTATGRFWGRPTVALALASPRRTPPSLTGARAAA